MFSPSPHRSSSSKPGRRGVSRVKSQEPERAGFLDRTVCALFSGLSALCLGSVLWWVIAAELAQYAGGVPFWPVVALAAGAAVLGFLLCSNVVASMISGLMSTIQWLVRWGT